MVDSQPLSLSDVLRDEYKALRPDADRPKAPLTALCLSGGGIRSATFALGVIQGLAERGVLNGFDYLSTVSGGGYVGGWLSSWKQRANGIDKVIPQLCRDSPVRTSTVKKSVPARTAICAAMKSFQVVFWLRFGTGAMPCRLRILPIV